MHRPSLNFPTLLKSSLAALVIAAGLLSTSGVLLAGTPGNCGEGYIEIYSATGANTCQKQTTAGPVADGTTAAAPAVVPNTTLAPDDDIFSTLASVASGAAATLGQLVVTVLGITIPLMQYQGFTSSLVVGAGWAIVRDVVNMFFVIILIVIAMMTIFGSSSVQWRQAVPKLMIMALVINFSKTLCGLMIDFSQVIMLTFANALKDIAGGNFIQLLGLGPILSLSPSSTATIGSFDLFAASAAAVLMMVWVLAIVVMLMFILVYRIVMLWILIVVAPLAWFTKVVPFASAKASYADWWKNFVCYCSVGPVITFFLWLTLAVAGAGSIAANDPGFSATGVATGGINPTGGLTKIFELEHLSSFVIGMALLVAGMDAAAKVCAGVKGPGFSKMLAATKGGGFINQGAASVGKWAGKKGGEIGAKAVKGVGSAAYGLGAGTLSAGKTAAYAVGGAALTAGGAAAMYAGKNLMEGTASQIETNKNPDGTEKKDLRYNAKKMLTAGGRAELLRDASKMAGEAGIPILGGAAAARLGGMAGEQEKAEQEEIKAAGKGILAKDKDTQLAHLSNIAKNGASSIPSERKKGLAVYMAAIKDKEMRKKMDDPKNVDANGKTEFDRLNDIYKGDMAKFSKTTELGEEVKKFKKIRPDMAGDEAIENINSDNVEEVDAAAYRDQRVRERLAKIPSKRVKSTVGGKTEYFNELEEAQQNQRGQMKFHAATGPARDKTGRPVISMPSPSTVVPSYQQRQERTPEEQEAEDEAVAAEEERQRTTPTAKETERARTAATAGKTTPASTTGTTPTAPSPVAPSPRPARPAPGTEKPVTPKTPAAGAPPNPKPKPTPRV